VRTRKPRKVTLHAWLDLLRQRTRSEIACTCSTSVCGSIGRAGTCDVWEHECKPKTSRLSDPTRTSHAWRHITQGTLLDDRKDTLSQSPMQRSHGPSRAMHVARSLHLGCWRCIPVWSILLAQICASWRGHGHGRAISLHRCMRAFFDSHNRRFDTFCAL
jgi:hypothetical protein